MSKQSALKSLLESEGFSDQLKELGWTPPSEKPTGPTGAPTFMWLKWEHPLVGSDKFREEYDQDSSDDEPFDGPPMGILSTDGFIPLKSYNNVSKAFDWWVVHTDFRITGEMKEILDDHDGIEILDVVTNNRIRIAIGLAYDGTNVRRTIEDKLTECWKNTYSSV